MISLTLFPIPEKANEILSEFLDLVPNEKQLNDLFAQCLSPSVKIKISLNTSLVT